MRIQLEAIGLEFDEGGNTIWVHGTEGTLLRLKCTGRITVNPCSAPCAHADAMIEGDVAFCVPSTSDRARFLDVAKIEQILSTSLEEDPTTRPEVSR